ncbi:MAG: L-histidine N(alpha)-methyltransferase [Chloroflexota bacterium]|nr:L-histidine N(alpha)-methyltransferase [Chloroflexota bacterium]MDE2886054.1 L-histidine N(alpha)-methyltransferase [Chloroflexota bacterium]
MTGTFAVTVRTSADEERASAAEEIVRGLTAEPKTLSPKFLYHEDGSELFDEITRLEEYYPTRIERSLLECFGAEIIDDVRPQEIVELGPGNSAKSGTLIGPALRAGTLKRYIPFDISEPAVREGAQALFDAYPDLGEVVAVVGDFERHLSAIPRPEGTRLIAFLGSTIGNLHPDERKRFLAEVRGLMARSEDALLLGADLIKETSIIEAAYNDARGITALFNLNSLKAVNDLLGIDIDIDLFRHRAFFNAEHSRIEMHLEAQTDVAFTLPASGNTVRIRAGETIWTESSYKFTKDGLGEALNETGFRNVRWFTDPEEMFALVLARP